MSAELEEYELHDHFFFKPGDSLATVCNAPDDRFGIYLAYALEEGTRSLVYIGISGNEMEDGPMQQKSNSLKGQFVSGRQFDNLRQKSWPTQMKIENIESLEIYWYVVPPHINTGFLRDIEINLLHKHLRSEGSVPRWNIHH